MASEIKMKMSLDSSAVKRALDKTQARLKSFGQAAKRNLSNFGGAAIAGGMAIAMKSAVDYGKEMLNLSNLANTSFEDFQKLAAAAKTVGIEQDKLADIYKDTSDKVGDFLETGGGAMKDYFENIAPLIGQTAEEFRGLSGADALQKYYDGLEAANVSQETMTFYMEAIASDSVALTPLLAKNGEAFKSLGDIAEASGRIMGESTAESLKKASAAIESFKQKAVITAGEILTMFSIALGGSNNKADATERKTRKDEGASRAMGVGVLQAKGVAFSKEDASRLADAKTSVAELETIMQKYGKTRLDLYKAIVSIRKKEREDLENINEEENKAKKAQAAELDKKEKQIDLDKKIKDARKSLNEADEKAAEKALSNAERLNALLDERAILQFKVSDDFSKGSQDELEIIKAKEKLIEVDGKIASTQAALNKEQAATAKAAKDEADAAKESSDIATEKADAARDEANAAKELAESQSLQTDLLEAQANQRGDLVKSIEKEIELNARAEEIMDRTGKKRGEAINLAKELMQIEAGADVNQSGFITKREQKAWDKKQAEIEKAEKVKQREEAREERRPKTAQERADERKADRVARAKAHADDRQARADKTELNRRKRRGEKAEDVLKEFAERKLKDEMKEAEKKGQAAVADLKKAREAAKAGKAVKKPENATFKAFEPILKEQLRELVSINKTLNCDH